MLSPRDLAYSLFGGPLILDVGPTINGEVIRVRVQPVNTISVTALVISLLLFIGFMYIYLYPLLRDRRARHAAKRARARSDAEQPGMQMDEEEKNSLLSWLHFRSRDRFSTAHNSPEPKQSPKLTSPFPAPPSLSRQPSSFTRGSLVPHLSPVAVTSPPPAYASQPGTPVPHFRFPSPLSSPRSNSSSSRSPSPLQLSPTLPPAAAPGPTPSRRVSPPSACSSTRAPSRAARAPHPPLFKAVVAAEQFPRRRRSRYTRSSRRGLFPPTPFILGRPVCTRHRGRQFTQRETRLSDASRVRGKARA
ncbi:hypothetical protein C8R46DRAFT_399973 [Mycena filopes]|nr:hypothetical protein C8R46DRAFT_399973 [Mycena filopes]